VSAPRAPRPGVPGRRRGALAVLTGLALALPGGHLLQAAPLPPAPESGGCVVGLPPTAACDGLLLAPLAFVGGRGIAPSALHRQLSLGPGDPFSWERWTRDLQNMRNSGLFRQLSATVREVAAGRLHLQVVAEVGWSLLPILGYQSGSVDILIAGLYDANSFHQYIELGGYYMRRDDYNLGRAWFLLPNIPVHGAQIEVQAVLAGSLLASYPGHTPPAGPADWRVPASGIEVLRRGGLIDLGYDLLPGQVTLSLRYLLLREELYPLLNLPAVLAAAPRGERTPALQRGTPVLATLSLPAINLRVGRADLLDNYRWQGTEARAVVLPSSRVWGSDRDFLMFYGTLRSFVPLAPRLDLAGQVGAGGSSSEDLVDQLTLGGDNLDPFVSSQPFPGLLNVRGFRSSNFPGRAIAFLNVEPRLRVTSGLPLPLVGPVAIQAALFADIGRAWPGGLADAGSPLAASVGGGGLLSLRDFRYAFLNWYCARTLNPYAEWSFNLVLTRPVF